MSTALQKHEGSQWKTFWQQFCPVPQTPVIAWLESMSGLQSRFLVTLTRVAQVETRLDSSHVFAELLDSSHNQWFETRVRVIFAKPQSLWSTNPVCLHTKKWSFFGPLIFKIAENFLFWLSSRVILYPNGQVFVTCTEVDLRFPFHWGASRTQYTVDLLTHHHDPIRYLHIVIVAVGHILLLWVFSRWSDLSYLNTNPMQKCTAQYNAYPNSCHCY